MLGIIGPSVFQGGGFQSKFRFSKWLFPFFQCFPENSVFSQMFKPFPFFSNIILINGICLGKKRKTDGPIYISIETS